MLELDLCPQHGYVPAKAANGLNGSEVWEELAVMKWPELAASLPPHLSWCPSSQQGLSRGRLRRWNSVAVVGEAGPLAASAGSCFAALQIGIQQLKVFLRNYPRGA